MSEYHSADFAIAANDHVIAKYTPGGPANWREVPVSTRGARGQALKPDTVRRSVRRASRTGGTISVWTPDGHEVPALGWHVYDRPDGSHYQA